MIGSLNILSWIDLWWGTIWRIKKVQYGFGEGGNESYVSGDSEGTFKRSRIAKDK